MFGLSLQICRQTYARIAPRERREVATTNKVIRVGESQGRKVGLGFVSFSGDLQRLSRAPGGSPAERRMPRSVSFQRAKLT